MPKAFDAQRLTITHDPNQRIDLAAPQLSIPNLFDFVGMIIDVVKDAILGIIEQLTGIDLSSIFEGIDLSPGGILSTIVVSVQNVVQLVIDAIVNGITGGTLTGHDLSAVLWALNPLNWAQQALTGIWQLFDPFLAQLAGIEGRLTAAESALFNTGNPLQYDSFNRDDIGHWTSVAGTLSIMDRSRIQVQAGLTAGYIGVTGDIREPASDKHGIHMKLVNQWDGVCRGFICSDTSMNNYAAIEVRSSLLGNDTIRVVSGSSPSVVVAHKQVDFGMGWLGQGLANGTVVSFEYDPPTNSFYVLRNNTLIPELTWEDEGNTVLHGPTKRKVGVVSNGDNAFGYTGFGITDFTYYDKP